MRQHMRGVAAVARDAGRPADVLTGEGVAAPAVPASAAGAAEPADADPRADAPAGDVGADRLDHADDFVTGNAGIGDPRHEALDGDRIAVADAAGQHPQAHLVRTGLGRIALHHLKRPAWFGNDHRAHFRHGGLLVAIGINCITGNRAGDGGKRRQSAMLA